MTHPPMPPARRVDVGPMTLSVHEAGPEDGIPVVLLHGWPELALSWAQQVKDLSEAGYRVLAPDMPGFGASDAPHEVDAYHVDRLCEVLGGLLDAYDLPQAIMVGHDWGGIFMWQAACLMGDRFLGAVGVNTPHLPRGSEPPSAAFRERGGDEHYILRFQNEAMDSFFVGQEDAFFAFTFGAPIAVTDSDQLPPSITHLPRRFQAFVARGGTKSEDDLVVPAPIRAQYAEVYRQTGFRGGLNYYRNFDANWERMGGVDHRLSMPCLMISTELDFMLPPKLAAWMPALCKDLTHHIIDDCGHWTMYEASEELSALLLGWLNARFPV